MADERSWEYRDLIVPLGLRSTDADLERRYYAAVLEHLGRAGEEGWRADGPIDLRGRLAAGAVRAREEGIRPTSWGRTTYESVTIRIKRPRP